MAYGPDVAEHFFDISNCLKINTLIHCITSYVINWNPSISTQKHNYIKYKYIPVTPFGGIYRGTHPLLSNKSTSRYNAGYI